MVAGRDVGDAITDRLDCAGELVADHARVNREGVGAVVDVQVRSADPGALDTHQHLAGLDRPGIRGVFGAKGQHMRLFDDQGNHGNAPQGM